MRMYPAIDLKDGECVRLFKGDYDKKTVYSSDAVATALKWQSSGADFLHVVDLDGARSGDGKNRSIIKKICQSVSMRVQTGGGIRTMEDIDELIEAGVSRVILGTAAVKNFALVEEATKKYGDRIAVGIDAKDGFVATDGWEKVSGLTAVDFAKKVKEAGVRTIIYTDIATDGAMCGPNTAAMEEMVKETGLDVIASGGVSCIEDIRALLKTGVEGAITGRAIYDGALDLKEAVELCSMSN
ncbi:MAG: 1-(5-phosphoribosyl)-5-[Clostridia bacterium]|nr:1-(5-phosphoribosyl)-5-[(5-phosphoribosylamino)methylideneamino]imidazole-4-carboxamide isomerase [Clostridia bacterium]